MEIITIEIDLSIKKRICFVEPQTAIKTWSESEREADIGQAAGERSVKCQNIFISNSVYLPNRVVRVGTVERSVLLCFCQV